MKFYSPYSACPKCGNTSFAIGTKYMPLITGRAVIRRTCGRCSFTWDEKPLDAKPVDGG